MGMNSKIEWTEHTFNPWSGCTKVSPGCANCYAETLALRSPDTFGEWGKGAPRRRTGEHYWNDPLRWNRKAGEDELAATQSRAIDYRRPRVFCASLADWLDDEVPVEWLRDLLALIHRTPHLDWLLLSKRPENWGERIEAVLKLIEGTPGWDALPNSAPEVSLRNFLADWFVLKHAPVNVWIGTSVENQNMAARRIPEILSIPATVRFLSCEPLLGPVSLKEYLRGHCTGCVSFNCELHGSEELLRNAPCNQSIHWVIAGGESGPGARPMEPDWARMLRDECAATNTAFLFKQWGGVHKTDTGRTLDGRTHDSIPRATSPRKSAAGERTDLS